MEELDVVVLGAGPGGYTAALGCAQAGLRTACVDDRVDGQGNAMPGGTCLNVGCIPSKSLLDSSHLYQSLVGEAAEHGILAGAVALDLARMQGRKQKVVETLAKGIAALFRGQGVQAVTGRGRLVGEQRVEVTAPDGSTQLLRARNIILATGSAPATLPGIEVEQSRIVDSTGALAFGEVPGTLAIIGAGAIGLELGSVWRRLGARVVLLEAQDRLLPSLDSALTTELQRSLRRQGLELKLGVGIEGIETTEAGVTITHRIRDKLETLEAERLVVAAGRRPRSETLGLEAVGLATDQRGCVPVDDCQRTALPGIYAIGDLTPGPMLAHRAMAEAQWLAGHLAGRSSGPAPRRPVPWVVYTWPEVAWVGPSQQQLEAEGRACRSAVASFRASGRAHAHGCIEGSAKVIADAEGQVLAAHVFGPAASELVAEAVLAMTHGLSVEQLAESIHAHPTLSETLGEAALALTGRAGHG